MDNPFASFVRSDPFKKSFGFQFGQLLLHTLLSDTIGADLFVPMFCTGHVMMSKNPELLCKRIDAREEEKVLEE